MNSIFLSYAICRCTIAFIWFYHGLVPKLINLHEDELAMNMAMGLPRSGAEKVATIGGVVEIVISIAVLVFWQQRWPLFLTIIAMFGLLGFSVIFQPVLVGAAFNPVTTNIAMMALSAVGLHLQSLMRLENSQAAVVR